MTLQEFVVAVVNGVSYGFLLFLIAAGLSLVFGVLGVLNFAHGGFFMLGAFLAYQIGGAAGLPPWRFLLVVAAAGIVTSIVAMVVEVGLFRPMYARDHLDWLLMTFSLSLVAEGAVREIWGVNPVTVSFPDSVDGAFTVLDAKVPQYSVFIIIVGLAVVVGLSLLLFRTRWGQVIQAVAEDRWMAQALGINVNLVFTAVFGLGLVLAGIAGGMVAPTQALTPQLGAFFLIQAFAVVIVGGLDSVPGALIAAILLGLLNSFLVATLSWLAPYSFYLGLIVVLLVRPQGLLGSKELLRRVS
ncbi:MAG: branched-chain amino acid ABC transporter permease [Acidimicrobiales bacterium]